MAAHLYEKPPHLFGMPGGYLNTTQTTFSALDDSKEQGDSYGPNSLSIPVVECIGTTMSPTPPTVKLEGARVRGHRAVRLVLQDARDRGESSQLPPLASPTFAPAHSLSSFVYGEDGVEARPVDVESGERELGILVSVQPKVRTDVETSPLATSTLASDDDISKGYWRYCGLPSALWIRRP